MMKILIKIGSALMSKDNKFNYEFLKSKVEEISELHKRGNKIIIVSSGAVACGMEIENMKVTATVAITAQKMKS